MKIGAIIQARTSSTRLPRKVLKPLPYDLDITVLQQVIRRVKKSKLLNEIIIATTTDMEDEEIIKKAEKEHVKWFKGSRENVLERYYLAAKENKLDVIVRITSDCPCIDWDIVDKAIEKHIKESADYTSNAIKRTFPHGLDVEVIFFGALKEAYSKATEDFEKEHVTPYIYRTAKDKFKIIALQAPQELNAPDIRITLDTEEDYALLCAVYDYLYEKNQFFDAYDIANLFKIKPWLKVINKKVLQKKIFNTFEEELDEVKKLLKMQELNNVLRILESWKT
jgi:spore coat polysaccharide biosynthesis protein SpsF